MENITEANVIVFLITTIVLLFIGYLMWAISSFVDLFLERSERESFKKSLVKAVTINEEITWEQIKVLAKVESLPHAGIEKSLNQLIRAALTTNDSGMKAEMLESFKANFNEDEP